MCRKLFYLFYVILMLAPMAETANGAVANQNGVDFEYFEGKFYSVSDLNDLTPVRTGVRDNFNISPYWQDDYWGYRFTAYIEITQAGEYTFYTASDDGSCLWIGDTLVVDNDGIHGAAEESGSITLGVGKHPITVAYIEHTGWAWLEVKYEGPGVSKMNIPDEVLYRTCYTAFDPSPADGAVGVPSDADLSWSPGAAVADVNGHDVYFGTTSPPPLLKEGHDVNSYDPAALVNGTTYYWRIDEVNDPCVWEGDQWSFTVIPLKAWNPTPANSVQYVPIDANLSWLAGEGAASHDVYFGTNPTPGAGEFQGNQTETTFDPGILDYNTTYYWRIDEKNGGTVTGDVWSFTTVSDIIEDPNLIGHWKFDEGAGSIAYDASGHGNEGTLQDNPVWVAGQVDGALELDGDGDYVAIENESNFDITDAITVMAWIKVKELDKEWQAIVTKGDDSWRLHRKAFTNNVDFTCTGVGSVSGNTNINDGQWHHVAGVYDGAKLYLYVDGLLDTYRDASGSIATNDDPVWIGENEDQQGRYWNGLIDDVRIYNRALSYFEIRVLAGCDLALAWDPSPADGAVNVSPDVDLGWRPGIYAVQHDVYFGEDYNEVNDANTATVTIYRGRQEPNSYSLEMLEFGKTYYWRIDEVNDPCVWKGDVWSFTVTEYFTVEDFEAYQDPASPKIADTWIEDGDAMVYLQRYTLVHSGMKSMRFHYDYGWCTYSTATRTFTTAQDWSGGGVEALYLWFYGVADNDINNVQMYVELEDDTGGSKKVTYDGPANFLKSEAWHTWRIDLQEFEAGGVDISSVKKITIGFDHGTYPPSTGGKIYFDDISLYPPRCIPEYVPADFTRDCVIDLKDLDIFTGWWLRDKPSGIVNGDFSEELNNWTWYCNYTMGDIGLVVDPCDGGAYHQMLPECSTHTNFGIYQVVNVIPGEYYTIDANWYGDVSGEPEISGGWAEVKMFCVDDPYDEDKIVYWAEHGTPIVAKHECEAFGPESITEAMTGYPNMIGDNTIIATTPYMVIATTLGGWACGHYMFIDDIELTGPWPYSPADFNTDEAVNFEDFAEMANLWLEGPILWP